MLLISPLHNQGYVEPEPNRLTHILEIWLLRHRTNEPMTKPHATQAKCHCFAFCLMMLYVRCDSQQSKHHSKVLNREFWMQKRRGMTKVFKLSQQSTRNRIRNALLIPRGKSGKAFNVRKLLRNFALTKVLESTVWQTSSYTEPNR